MIVKKFNDEIEKKRTKSKYKMWRNEKKKKKEHNDSYFFFLV